MKLAGYLLVVLVFFSSSVSAKSASETAKDYYAALKQKDYVAAAGFFDPAALDEFRQMMGFINEIPAEGQKGFFEAFFGPGSTRESVSKLSSAAFFSSFLRAVMAQVEAKAQGGLNLEGMEVLGEVAEGPGISHVVTRQRVSVGQIEVEAMEVISFRKNGNQWNALMTGKMKGMANQLRAALSRQKRAQ